MLSFIRKLYLPSAALISLLTYSQNALAKPAEGWHLLVAPYGWMSGLNADLRIRNRSTDVNVPFSKILKHLSFAAQGHIEAGYGPWTLMLDPTYLRVTDSHQSRLFNLKIVSKTTLVDAGVFYRIFSRALAPNAYVSFEFFGGLRHLGIENTMNFNPGRTLSDATEMTAPILGARIKADASAKLSFWLRGDVGGFNVDHLKNTWNMSLGFSYALKKHIALGLAYRVLKINYNRANSGMNLLMHGPMLGLGFQFQ